MLYSNGGGSFKMKLLLSPMMISTIGVLIIFVIEPISCVEIQQHVDLYGSTVWLNCSSQDYQPGDDDTSVTHQWVLPSGDVQSQSLRTTNSQVGRIALSDDGIHLQIKRLDKPDFGMYICLVVRTDSGSPKVIHAIRHGVNMDGPYYGDQLAKYQPHMRNGLIAGAAVFVFSAMICCNLEQASTRYDKKVRQKQEGSRHAVTSVDRVMQYYNNGLVFDDITELSFRQLEEEMKEKPTTKL